MLVRLTAIFCIMGQLAAPAWAGVCCALFGDCGPVAQQSADLPPRPTPTPPESAAPAAIPCATSCDRAPRFVSCCSATAPSSFTAPDAPRAEPGPTPARCALSATPARRSSGCCAETRSASTRCAAQPVDNLLLPDDPALAPTPIRLRPIEPAPRGAQNCECCPLTGNGPCAPPPATPPSPTVKLLELALAAGVCHVAVGAPAASLPAIPEAFGEIVPYHSHNQRQAILALWLE